MGGPSTTNCIWTVLFVSHCSTSLPVGPDIEARARLIKVFQLLSLVQKCWSMSCRTCRLGCLPERRSQAKFELGPWSKWASRCGQLISTSRRAHSAQADGWPLSGMIQGGDKREMFSIAAVILLFNLVSPGIVGSLLNTTALSLYHFHSPRYL